MTMEMKLLENLHQIVFFPLYSVSFSSSSFFVLELFFVQNQFYYDNATRVCA